LIQNAAPTAGISGPARVARDATANFTLTATDPSASDQAAGFTWSIDWNGDGSDIQVVSGQSGLVVPHTFSTSGSKFIGIRATDKDGDISSYSSRIVMVSAAQLVENSGLADLVWTGTAGDDYVYFEDLGGGDIRVITAQENGLSIYSIETISGVTGIVKASGLAGDDFLDGRWLSTTSTRLDGGTGNNTLYGGGANDVLIGGGIVAPKNNGPEGQQGSNIIVGGAGDDVIYGNAVNGAEGKGGNNILLGGDGDDTIYGNWTDGGEGGGRNILVGGADADTLYDYKIADGAEGKGSILISGETLLGIPELSQVMLEWASTHTYNDRVANILGPGAPGRLNGGAYLHPGSTVTNDAAVDHLWGSTGGTAFNWFLYTLAVDEINRAKIGETHTFL
jgi:Ca2+-binding RTX toxin-like protein